MTTGIPTPTPIHDLDKSMPAAAKAQLGHTLADIIAAYNDMRTQYLALLAHLDTANVAGIGNGNTAAFTPTLPALLPVGQRGR